MYIQKYHIIIKKNICNANETISSIKKNSSIDIRVNILLIKLFFFLNGITCDFLII
jgi:hypothetical protein